MQKDMYTLITTKVKKDLDRAHQKEIATIKQELQNALEKVDESVAAEQKLRATYEKQVAELHAKLDAVAV